ncbi:MAG: hypothetical protein ABL933_04495 [Methyloglobulus sp.]|nr:DUF4153 domain-containing protein [Methyloglobulus sp.]
MDDDSPVEEQNGWFERTWQAVGQVFERFPLSALCLAALNFHVLFNGQSLLTYAPGFEWQSFLAPYNDVPIKFRQYFWLISTGFFGFAAVVLATENKGWRFTKRYGLAIGFYAVYAFYLHSEGSSIASTISAQTLCLGFAISVSFAPWLLRPSSNLAYWQFSRYCMGSFIKVSLLTALVFFAFFLCDVMSRNSVGSIVFLWRWPILIWLFGWMPIAFLAGIPNEIGNEMAQTKPLIPSGFGWCLSAIGMIAVAFLYNADTIKYYLTTIPSTEWLGLSVVLGTVLPHVTYPLSTRNSVLSGLFYKSLYLFLLTPVAYLAYVLKIRLDHYGLTEWRYFGVLICVWVLICIGLFYFGRQPFQLQTAPKVLSALCILASIGFWQIGKLPNKLQFAELERLLTSENLLANGRYVTPSIKKQPTLKVRKQIMDKITYLANVDNKEKFRSWFDDKKAFGEAANCDGQYHCIFHYEQGLLNLMQLITVDLKTFEFPTSNEEYAPYSITSPYKDETLKADQERFAGYTDLEGYATPLETYLYKAKDYDYVIQYNNINLASNDVVDSVFDIMLDLETYEKERVRMTYKPNGSFELAIGKASPPGGQIDYQGLEEYANPDEYLTKLNELYENQSNKEKQLLRDLPFVKGSARKITLDLQAFIEGIVAKYHDSLKLDERVFNQLPTELKLEKDGSNPLRIEKTANGLKLKIEMTELCIKARINSDDKTPCGFSGMVYVKKII